MADVTLVIALTGLIAYAPSDNGAKMNAFLVDATKCDSQLMLPKHEPELVVPALNIQKLTTTFLTRPAAPSRVFAAPDGVQYAAFDLWDTIVTIESTASDPPLVLKDFQLIAPMEKLSTGSINGAGFGTWLIPPISSRVTFERGTLTAIAHDLNTHWHFRRPADMNSKGTDYEQILADEVDYALTRPEKSGFSVVLDSRAGKLTIQLKPVNSKIQLAVSALPTEDPSMNHGKVLNHFAAFYDLLNDPKPKVANRLVPHDDMKLIHPNYCPPVLFAKSKI